MDPGFLFCKLASHLLGFWDWIYLNGHCWPQASRSDAFGLVSKELPGYAAIADVDLEITLWDHAVLVGAKVHAYPKGACWPAGSHRPALCEVVLSFSRASPTTHSCPLTFLMGTLDAKGDDHREFAFEALASQRFIFTYPHQERLCLKGCQS